MCGDELLSLLYIQGLWLVLFVVHDDIIIAFDPP